MKKMDPSSEETGAGTVDLHLVLPHTCPEDKGQLCASPRTGDVGFQDLGGMGRRRIRISQPVPLSRV